MKSILLILLVLAASSMSARATEWTTDGAAATALARGLNHATLRCSTRIPDDGEEKGFFPLSISAIEKRGTKNVVLRIDTASPKAGFEYGGRELTDFEMTHAWFVISVGDDGRRHLFLSRDSMPDVRIRHPDLACEVDAETGRVIPRGEITGIVSEIWDSGTMHSVPINCCAEYPAR